jgi:hypothetical protein
MAFFTAQLIVGPPKINTKLLRQTFGERFLSPDRALEFPNEFECYLAHERNIKDTSRSFNKRVM